jgi:2-oxoglutarate ferredoxin oxidoreductase subunit delta
MAYIKINSEKCKGCCLCVPECPRGLVHMSELFNKSGHQFAEMTDLENCSGCALCCQMCPDIAIEIEESEPKSKDKKAIPEKEGKK